MIDNLGFLFGRMLAAVVLLPLTLIFTLAYIHVLARVFGIGRHNPDSTGLKAAFNLLEGDPRALAIFLGSTVVAAALLAGRLIG